LHTNHHVTSYWLNSALHSHTYLQTVLFSHRITGIEARKNALSGERLVSVLALFVWNCKWHCAVQIQLVTAAHGKDTLWRVTVCGYRQDLLYRTVWCMSNGNIVVRGTKLRNTFQLKAQYNADRMTYTIFYVPP
jgi:hypothetical protein